MIMRPLPGIISRAAGGSSLLTDLVSWWALDEISGTRIDAHGSNDLTDNNTVTNAAGKQGNAGQFTRANSEWLSHVAGHGCQGGARNFTACGWVYFDSKALYPNIIICGTNDSGAGLDYLLGWSVNNSRMRMTVGSGASELSVSATSYGAVANGTWIFVCGEYDHDNDAVRISVNDGTVNETIAANTPNTSGGPIYIGRGYYSTSYLDGRLDEIAFWSRLLTTAEKTALYNGGAGMAYPG